MLPRRFIPHTEHNQTVSTSYSDKLLDDFTSLSAYGTKGSPALWRDPGDKGVSSLLRHFCDAALGKEDLLVTARDGLRATVCAVQALESARTGAPVYLG